MIRLSVWSVYRSVCFCLPVLTVLSVGLSVCFSLSCLSLSLSLSLFKLACQTWRRLNALAIVNLRAFANPLANFQEIGQGAATLSTQKQSCLYQNEQTGIGVLDGPAQQESTSTNQKTGIPPTNKREKKPWGLLLGWSSVVKCLSSWRMNVVTMSDLNCHRGKHHVTTETRFPSVYI